MRNIIPLFLALSSFLFVSLAIGRSERMKYTDEQIMSILKEINHHEIEMTKLAKTRTANKSLIKMGDHMLQEKAPLHSEGSSINKDLFLAPANSKMLGQLQKKHERSHALFKTLEGRLFDSAYLDDLAAEQKHVLLEINQHLLPSARNPRIRELLRKTRTSISGQLKQVEDFKAQL